MRLILGSWFGHAAERPPLLRWGEEFGLRSPKPAEMAAARAFGAERIRGEVVSLDTLSAVARIAPGAVLIKAEGDEIVGLLAVLPLREPGRAALLAGRFDAVDVASRLVARPAERPAAVYAWACAAKASHVARALLGATDSLARAVFPEIPFFARAATADGRRVLLGSLGYRAFGPAAPDLLWRPPAARAAA